MKTIHVKPVLLSVILLLFFSICKAQSLPSDFDYGHIENNVYKNSYFGMQITIPEKWVVQNKEQIDNVKKMGAELVAGDDEKMKAVLKAAEVKSASLLAVYQYEMGSPVSYNPSIMVMAENIKSLPGIKNGSDYLFQAKKLLEQSQMKYDHLDKKFDNEWIGGVEFYKMNANIKYMGLNLHQVYYSSVLNNFSFIVILSYNTKEEQQNLLNVLKTLQFKK